MAKSISIRKNTQAWYKRAILFALLLTMCLTIYACSSTEKKVVGTWLQTTADQVGSLSLVNGIVLEADGTFYAAVYLRGNYDTTFSSMRGTYKVEDNTITCTVASQEILGELSTANTEMVFIYNKADDMLVRVTTGSTYTRYVEDQ